MGAQGTQGPDQSLAIIYYRCRRFCEGDGRRLGTELLPDVPLNALYLLSSQGHKTHCQWTCPEPVFAVFLFLFSYYIVSCDYRADSW